MRTDYDLNPDWPAPAKSGFRRAAVLMGLIDRGDDYAVLLTLRPDTMPSHAGQVAFPGGRMETGETALHAALREMNRSLVDVAGGLLVVSQFTLAADVRGGNRPSFTGAAPSAQGRALYEALLARARAAHPQVASGEFGADMQVHLVNDGPVTLPITLR